jgi:hypothetical protein
MDRGISIDSDSKMNAESSKLQTTQRDLSSSTVERYGVAKGIEEGFGTAPIWFQQSMANGPPVHTISLGKARQSSYFQSGTTTELMAVTDVQVHFSVLL